MDLEKVIGQTPPAMGLRKLFQDLGGASCGEELVGFHCGDLDYFPSEDANPVHDC